MQAAMAMSVAAYEDEGGQVHVIYENIADVAKTYGVDPDSGAVMTVAGALDALTDKAVATD